MCYFGRFHGWLWVYSNRNQQTCGDWWVTHDPNSRPHASACSPSMCGCSPRRRSIWGSTKVTVQYVGRLELAGEVHDLDSSDGTGGFTYTLGQGDLCKGLEHGLPTMRKGERAKFTMTAAFGPKDLAEKHADKADTADQLRVIYEVELISWKARTDLFADGSVIKTCVEEGSGWKMPRLKEEAGD